MIAQYLRIKELERRIERLEAALREIADDPTGVSLAQADIAREALERK